MIPTLYLSLSLSLSLFCMLLCFVCFFHIISFAYIKICHISKIFDFYYFLLFPNPCILYLKCARKIFLMYPTCRSRLQSTGLKLKIPVRSSPQNAQPYNAANRPSASPKTAGSDGGGSSRPSWPSPSRKRPTVTFDASVNNRPVWEVRTESSPSMAGPTDDYRQIPIQIVRGDESTAVNLVACDTLTTIRTETLGASAAVLSRPPPHPGRFCDIRHTVTI